MTGKTYCVRYLFLISFLRGGRNIKSKLVFFHSSEYSSY